MKVLFLCEIISTLLLVRCRAYNISELRELRTHLFKDYDTRLRPVINQSEFIEVRIRFVCRSLLLRHYLGNLLTCRFKTIHPNKNLNISSFNSSAYIKIKTAGQTDLFRIMNNLQ